MRLHEIGPLAVMPPSILGLTRDDRVEDLPLEHAVEPLAGGELESLQREIDRIGFVLGAHLPLVAPLEAILVHVTVDEIAVHIGWPAEGGVRAPHKYGLH